MNTTDTQARNTAPDIAQAADSHTRGMAVFAAILPDMPEKLHAMLAPIAPEMEPFVVDVAGGDILARPQLDMQSREVATIAALAAMGTAAPQLAVHIRGGLASGLTPQQVVDIMYLVAVFAGFPAALNAIAAAGQVFAETGQTFSPACESLPDDQRHERGMATLNATSNNAGEAVVATVRKLSPALADLIVRFSYGDVIARPHLTPAHKEIAMIACAAARGGQLPQLKVHVQAALNVGMSQEEIVEVCVQMAIYAGVPAALNALFAAREVFDAQ